MGTTAQQKTLLAWALHAPKKGFNAGDLLDWSTAWVDGLRGNRGRGRLGARLAVNGVIHLLAVDRNLLRGDNPETDFVSPNLHHRDGDVVIDHNAFVFFLESTNIAAYPSRRQDAVPVIWPPRAAFLQSFAQKLRHAGEAPLRLKAASIESRRTAGRCTAAGSSTDSRRC